MVHVDIYFESIGAYSTTLSLSQNVLRGTFRKFWQTRLQDANLVHQLMSPPREDATEDRCNLGIVNLSLP